MADTSFQVDSRCDRYCVVGNPIGHSLSPRIHQAFAEQTGERIDYRALLAPLDRFRETALEFFAAGGRGMNVTLPFKEEAWAFASLRSAPAETAGAANTLWRDGEGRYHGDNTDGIGFLRDYLGNHGGSLQGQRVLVLGAGGAVRGVLGPLMKQRPARLVVANRTLSKARALYERFSPLGEISIYEYGALVGQQFDAVINGTAASLGAELPPLPAGILAAGAWCYDLVYAPEPTRFMRWGLECGAARALDGLGMLVEQAAEAFSIWRRVRPATGPVIEMLRRE